MTEYVACPHCGAEIREDAHFCRHCGSSDADGWRDEVDTDVDDFDYDQYVAENFPQNTLQTSTPWLWRAVAVILLLMFLLGFLCF